MKTLGSTSNLERARVLIVDDVPENLTVLGEVLQGAGCIVQVANSGPAALRLATQTPSPELILLDVMMPGMDGYEVLRRLRAEPRSRDIPVMFLTALDDPRDEEHGLSLGAVDYLAKPIQPAVVLARVRSQIDARRLHEWLRDQNAALEAEVARRMAENDAIQQVTIRALAHLAETRDPETGNHILRTQAYMQLLARALSHHPRFAATLNEHTIELLTRSAPLHDIGKVGIPDHILLKPGRLTADEWEPMKTHAALGAAAIEQAERDIDRPVEFLSLAKQIARSHHERWDGSGYPDGLAGESIPIAARLMAVADVFDALISPRVYKRAMSFDEARRMISDGRGSHFDPAVVDVFEDEFQRFVDIANRHRDKPPAAVPRVH
ncbi:MAG TPA: two-component system response regulator [Ideonella sp.]|uniref:two-component system response regulator n=1 Tax=Ideonella sp. TaxID=1929293 RepID=UPI002C7C22AE|nr:two-component system response regulator [Ideonella sp.]HSI51812.1 two-component system response regulator [Ideonella sp.]